MNDHLIFANNFAVTDYSNLVLFKLLLPKFDLTDGASRRLLKTLDSIKSWFTITEVAWFIQKMTSFRMFLLCDVTMARINFTSCSTIFNPVHPAPYLCSMTLTSPYAWENENFHWKNWIQAPWYTYNLALFLCTVLVCLATTRVEANSTNW